MFVEWPLKSTTTSGFKTLLSSQLRLASSICSLSFSLSLWDLESPSEDLCLSLPCFLSLVDAVVFLGLVRLLPSQLAVWLEAMTTLVYWAGSPSKVLFPGLCLTWVYILWFPGVDWFLAYNHTYKVGISCSRPDQISSQVNLILLVWVVQWQGTPPRGDMHLQSP